LAPWQDMGNPFDVKRKYSTLPTTRLCACTSCEPDHKRGLYCSPVMTTGVVRMNKVVEEGQCLIGVTETFRLPQGQSIRKCASVFYDEKQAGRVSAVWINVVNNEQILVYVRVALDYPKTIGD